MPCYSRVQSSVEFGDKTDTKLLEKALRELGYSVSRNGSVIEFYAADHDGALAGNQMTFNHSGALDVTATRNAIKRAYSAEVVKSAAQRFGWQVKQSSPTQFQVTRRF